MNRQEGLDMEIREAIIHARQVAKDCDGNRDCKYQHDQLADWLEELSVFKDAEEQRRLLILPSPQEMQGLNYTLCEFCRAKEYNRMFHTPNGIDLGCEGSHCGEAYEKYLDNVYDAAGVELNPPNKRDSM